MSDKYNTIKTLGEGLYKEKGSKFIAFAFPVKTEEQIKEIIAAKRKEYYNARHVCYAYKLGYNEEFTFRMNDDGEPSGTAGKPIYGQILSHDLTDILIVVVRYFGGTKLGVSGLINAYKSSAIEAIEQTEVVEVIRRGELTVNFDFPLTNEAMRIVKDHQLGVVEQTYDTGCHLTVSIRLSEMERVKSVFEKVHGITINKED